MNVWLLWCCVQQLFSSCSAAAPEAHCCLCGVPALTAVGNGAGDSMVLLHWLCGVTPGVRSVMFYAAKGLSMQLSPQKLPSDYRQGQRGTQFCGISSWVHTLCGSMHAPMKGPYVRLQLHCVAFQGAHASVAGHIYSVV